MTTKDLKSEDAKTGSDRPSRNLTSKTKPDLPVGASIRLAILTLRGSTTEEVSGAFKAAVPQVFGSFEGRRILLLPGVRFKKTRRTSKKMHPVWPLHPDDVVPVLSKSGVAALFESYDEDGRAYRAFEPGKGLLPVEIRQVFATSEEANKHREKVADLVTDCNPGGERTIVVGGLPIGLLVCGENNILANRQSKGNEAYIRHNLKGALFPHLKVVFNGAHTPMGNWGKLERRFEYLSRDNRWVFYATNTERTSWGRSVLRAYYNGRLIADSEAVRVRDMRPVAGGLVDGGEDFRALWFEIPGKMLRA